MMIKNHEDNPYLLWQRNVKDELKDLSNEEIKERLKENAKPFSVMMSQVHSDFNFGTLVRNANNFGAREVFYFGEHKRWNKNGALGVYNYTPVKHLKTIDEIKALKAEYEFVGIENNIEGTTRLQDFKWDASRQYMLVFGEETAGLTNELLAMMDHLIEIQSFGSVRSINVGSAGAIVMNDYITRSQ